MSALLVLALLASSSDAPMPLPATAQASAPVEARETARPAELELIIPERLIEELLTAAAPFDRVIHQEVAAFGLTQRVRLDLRLMRPRVKVAKEGVRVTFDYDLRGPAGLSARGEVTPLLQLRALPGRGVLEGRLTGAKISATALEVPLDDLVDPVLIPAMAEGPMEVGPQTVHAELSAREVVLEEGRVRVLGAWLFRKAPAAPAKVSADVP